MTAGRVVEPADRLARLERRLMWSLTAVVTAGVLGAAFVVWVAS